MRNDFDLWKSTCQIKYGVFRDLAQYNFSIFPAHIYILLYYIILGLTHASHKYTDYKD